MTKQARTRLNPAKSQAASESSAERIGPPLVATIVERMDFAIKQLHRIKSPGVPTTHARAQSVYLLLTDKADQTTGEIRGWPADRIARTVGCSSKQAGEALGVLIGLGLLTKSLGTSRRGRWPMNVYVLRTPVTDGGSPPMEADGSTDGGWPPSPMEAGLPTDGGSPPTIQKEIQKESGLSVQGAGDRACKEPAGEIPPAGSGEADSAPARVGTAGQNPGGGSPPSEAPLPDQDHPAGSDAWVLSLAAQDSLARDHLADMKKRLSDEVIVQRIREAVAQCAPGLFADRRVEEQIRKAKVAA